MPRKRIEAKATIGFVEQGNSVIAVTISAAQVVLDRRLIALTHGLPTHPYHHEGAWALGRYLDSPWAQPTSLPAAMALIKEVTEAAHHGAHAALARLARDISVPIGQVAIRALPPLPATIEERVRDHRAQLVADSAMYREAVATAATARGWTVCWYEKEQVPRDLANALGVKDLPAFLTALGGAIGPPWRATHKLAAAAALSVLWRQQ